MQRALILAFAFVVLFGISSQVPSTRAATPPSYTCDGPCHGRRAPGSPFPAGKIQYVIVIVQENRTPDNLFQGLPGADIASSGHNSMGKVVALVPKPLAVHYDPLHTHGAFLTEYAKGAMNGWNLETFSCWITPCATETAFSYARPKDVLPYLTMAKTYAFADRMFQDNQGPSFPAHQFIIAGTSTDKVGSKLLAAENPNYTGGSWMTAANCGGAKGSTVTMIDPAGNETATRFPCFEHPTIMDLLDAKSISWRYYNSVSGGFWSAPDAIHHLRFGPDWSNVIVPETTIKSDIAAGTLPHVSWVTPSGAESDHAGTTNGSGPAYVASIVNAVGKSKYWKNTAIFIVWDDWGGWFDHVKPVIYGSYEVGFRVPLIVVSPYAKQKYVSHVRHEQASILHFIETTFGLGTLGYADARADNLADCFNFSQPPAPFAYIPTPGWSGTDLARAAGPTSVPPDDDF